MKILKRILLVIAILLTVVALIGLMLPSHVHVERSTTINKSKELVFDYISSLKNWNTWAPWYELDTTASYTQSGPESGVGAKLSWVSTVKDVGRGSLTCTEAVEHSLIKQDLNFMEEGFAKGEFKFEDVAGETKVTWSFEFDTGFNPLLRIMGKFMDSLVGKDFERGLLKLKSVLEAMPSEEIQDNSGSNDTNPMAS